MKVWSTDKRDRCGNCLVGFRRGQLKFPKYPPWLVRFPNLCLKCRDIVKKKEVCHY